MKKKTSLESQNFLTNVIILAFMGLGVNGIDTALNPGEFALAVLARDMEFLISVALPAIITITFKVTKNIQAKTFSFARMIKSPNFITQAITVLALLVGGIGIILPPDAPQALTGAIFSGSIGVIIAAVVLNVLNPLWHWLQNRTKKDPAQLPKKV